jgi:hypothetical protein
VDNRRGFFEVILGQESGYLRVAFLNARTRHWQEQYYSYPNSLDDVLEDIDRHLLTCNVYFCPTLFNEPKGVKQNITHSKVVWADLDTCHWERMKVEPTIVLETSPKRYQAFWVLNDLTVATDVEAVNKAVAYYHADQGCDRSGWDLTQMLRVPGTKNHKYIPDLFDVRIEHVDPTNTYALSDFQIYPIAEEADVPDYPEPKDLEKYGTAEDIYESHRLSINPRAWMLYTNVPTGDWSKALWQLELLLFAAGLSREEVFLIAKDSNCNKYKRDGRSDKFLWKEVCRAELEAKKPAHTPTDDGTIDHEIVWQPPDILSQEERDYCAKNPTFVEEYVEWAKTIGDAAWQYHQAGAFVILSSLLSGAVRLPTSFGTVMPNLWFMILADTTLTRKTTAMDMAMDLLYEVDPDCVLATDGSIEGLLTSLSMRPGRPSIFLRDEFSGLLEMVTKRDYYAGMLETLTKLYDGKYQKRVLRKETLEIRDPCVVFFAGGIKDRIMQLLTYEHIGSGFIPRFCFVTAESDVTRLKPLGPPTNETMGRRDELIGQMRQMYNHYNNPLDADSIGIPRIWEAKLTDDAWVRYNSIESMMLQSALDSNMPDILTPTFDRLCKSGLKASVLMAASNRLVDDVTVTERDLVRAFNYIEQWMQHTLYIIANIGKTASEVNLEKVYNYIKSNPRVSRSRIMQTFRLTARDAEATFMTLEQRGLIHRRKASRGESFETTSPINLKGVQAK